MTGVFCLRYDLAVSIFPTTSLGRWQSNLRHNSLDLRSSSLGSPPKARFFSRLPGLRHGAGGSALLAVYAWRTLCAVRQGLLHGGPARRSITFCQSCQGSAEKFGGFFSQNEPPQRTKKGSPNRRFGGVLVPLPPRAKELAPGGAKLPRTDEQNR